MAFTGVLNVGEQEILRNQRIKQQQQQHCFQNEKESNIFILSCGITHYSYE